MWHRWVGATVAGVFWCSGVFGADALPAVTEYVGSEGCAVCHPERYEGWRNSYHSSVTQDARRNPEAILGDFSQSEADFNPEDVELTIGGHWYQRYVVRLDGERFVLPRVWSVASHRWETQDAWSWRKKPYDVFCVGCHSTRYAPADHSYVEHKVGCEACHGPGGRHAGTRGKEAIVNPGRWGQDEQDLLCASCHVRGTDPSGRYHFAVGYVPGRALTDHYVPHRIPDGSTARETLLRRFRAWVDRLGDGPPPACDVCGIHREEVEGEVEEAGSETDRCVTCHKFGEDYVSHTRHPGGLDLQCLDCHREVSVARPASVGEDVHAPQYFLVHRDRGFESDVMQACQGCHTEMPVSQVFRKLLEWDHSTHLFVD